MIKFCRPNKAPIGLQLLIVNPTNVGKLFKTIDQQTHGAASSQLNIRGKQKKDEFQIDLSTCDARFLIWALSADQKIDDLNLQKLGGRILGCLSRLGVDAATIIFDNDIFGIGKMGAALQIAYGAGLRMYRFDKFKTAQKKITGEIDLYFGVANPDRASQDFGNFSARIAGVHLARDLANEPPNIMTPKALMLEAKALSKIGIEIDVLDRKAMSKLGMNALLAVAQGSKNEPYLVTMRWSGARNLKAAPVAFIGKGVTFDTGGLCIKPAMFMQKMKYDMCGAAAVIGVMKTLALRKAKLNAVGVVGLVENSISGESYRPSDVLVSMSGQTIEVSDTDAEGRLVLVDAMTYAKGKFNPKCLVDIATLTGTMRIALGHLYAGLFSNDDSLAAAIQTAGVATGERSWRMPVGAEYDGMIASKIADMVNYRTDLAAHAVVAAQFLNRFTDGLPWAHIDMGALYTVDEDTDLCPIGASGFGVRLLDTFAANYEK